MRTETVTRIIYTAAELKEHHPEGLQRALEDYARFLENDPPWAAENRDSLTAALEAMGDDPAEDLGTVPRIMAWVENNIIGPLRVPFGKIRERRPLAQYGAFYRPGLVKPCPWTGYYMDDALLDFIVKESRNGSEPADIKRRLPDECQRLADEDLEANCAEDAFLDTSNANGWEYYETGELA